MLGENLCVRIDRQADFTHSASKHNLRFKWGEKSGSDNTVNQITQVSDKTGFTVLGCANFLIFICIMYDMYMTIAH